MNDEIRKMYLLLSLDNGLERPDSDADHAVSHHHHPDTDGVNMTFAAVCILGTLFFLFVHEELTIFVILLMVLGQIML